MALGKTQGQKRNSIFVDLKFNATKGPEGVGFRQTTDKVASTTPGRNFDYKYAMHDYVEGHVAGFAIKEEPVYDKPLEKEFIGYASLSDPAGGENVVVKFPLAGGAGRKLVGLLNSVKENGGVVYLHTNMAESGTVIGNKTLIKPQAYINMRKGDSKGEKVVPLYSDADGSPMYQPSGEPAQLASGVKHVIAKKEIWDFAAADEMTLNTATVLVAHFAKAGQGDDQKHVESDGHEGGIDLDEAANAASTPRG